MKKSKMSLAAAAVEEFKAQGLDYVCSGDLNFFHDVIDRAGSYHSGPGTHWRVLGAMRKSPLWRVSGVVGGWGNARANMYIPTEIQQALT